MKLGVVLFFSSLLVLNPGRCLNVQEWKNLRPLKTTRAEVEATLGPAGEGFEVTYDLEDGKLSIEYSSGPCSSDRKGGWNVARDTVVSLLFTPRHPKRLSALKLDSKKFRKNIDRHLPSVTYYTNDDAGIRYAIQLGKVDYVEYSPPKKYDDLYCKN